MTEISQFKAEFFKALSHPLRIRILDALRKGEVGVNDLCTRLDVEQSNLSQQLAILRTRNIVATRKDGQNVYYSVQDPELFVLLDAAKKIFNNHLIDVKDLLSQLVTKGR
jgi:DNA-binding transcriptional ArsR family regulator